MRANYRRFIAVAGCIACSIPVHGAGQTNYPTVEMPSGYTESFHPDTRPIENQTQTAYLLVLLNLVDPTEGVEPEEMAPPEHLEEIGLGRELFDLVGQKSQPQSYARLADRLGLESPGFPRLPDELVERQRELARGIAVNPDWMRVAEFAVIALHHPDPLVRVAAAALVWVTTDGQGRAIEALREGVGSEDDRVRHLALTLLARLTPDDPVLDPWRKTPPPDAGKPEEPETTLVVHGTWARDNEWWQDDGDFFEYLQHDVPIDDLFLGDDPFAWSGDWDHDERVQAADDLVTWMNDHGETCVDIIAHSHGANIAFLAAPRLDYGRLIVLSTPSHRTRYSVDPDTSILSVRVKLDLVVLADGGGNRFPDAAHVAEVYIGWFNHSATHHPDEWVEDAIAGQMPAGQCPL